MAIVGIAITLNEDKSLHEQALLELEKDSRFTFGSQVNNSVAGVLDVKDDKVRAAFNQLTDIQGICNISLVCAYTEDACKAE